MSTAAVATLAVAAVLLVLGCVLLVLFGLLVRERRTTRELLEAAQARVTGLESRIAELEASPGSGSDSTARTPGAAGAPMEYVITTAGTAGPPAVRADSADAGAAPVADRLVLSATVGEPLVKAAAFGYAVRRALSPESRNRIRFAMGREVRRVRKQRRRDDRRAAREARAARVARHAGNDSSARGAAA